MKLKTLLKKQRFHSINLEQEVENITQYKFNLRGKNHNLSRLRKRIGRR